MRTGEDRAQAEGTVGPEWSHAEHLSEAGKIYLDRGGRGWVRHSGSELELRPHRVYLIPEAVPLAYGCRRSLTVDWLHFTGATEAGVSIFHLLPPAFETRVPAEAPAAALMDALIRLPDSGATLGSRLAASGMLHMLFFVFVEQETHTDSAARSRLLPVITHVDEHVGEQTGVARLAPLGRVQIRNRPVVNRVPRVRRAPRAVDHAPLRRRCIRRLLPTPATVILLV